VFDKIPTERVVLALIGTEAAFRDAVLSSLTSRARRLVESELESGADVPPRERARLYGIVLSFAMLGDMERTEDPVTGIATISVRGRITSRAFFW